MNIPPFKPEPLADLFRRFPAALVIEYHLNLVESGQQESPALQAKHRFDFPDGIRLIAAKENVGGTADIHLSFGIHQDHQPAWIAKGQAAYLLRCKEIIGLLQTERLLSPGPWSDTFITPRATHFWFKL